MVKDMVRVVGLGLSCLTVLWRFRRCLLNCICTHLAIQTCLNIKLSYQHIIFGKKALDLGYFASLCALCNTKR